MLIDYETYPLSRRELRFFTKVIKKKLNIKSPKFPVIEMLDVLEEREGVLLSIEPDEEFDDKVVAYLTTESNGTYVIHIRNTVYETACEGNKTSVGFICHEMCHYFLIAWFGYTPIYGRTLGTKKIDRFRSMEWQAKALCGELMIPYEDFLLASIQEIMDKTDSSFSQARYYVDVVRDSDDVLIKTINIKK